MGRTVNWVLFTRDRNQSQAARVLLDRMPKCFINLMDRTDQPALLRVKAEELLNENFRFRNFLKHQAHLSSRQIDDRVSRIEKEVWKKIDCRSCANCCRHVSPTLSEEDIDRLAERLDTTREQIITTYLDEAPSNAESPWIMRTRPCPFLKDNLCSVYEHRPTNCRDYPYLNKPDLIFRTLSMINRTAECPAVFEVWEKLKRETGFRRDG